MVKRLLDILLSFIGLPLSSPILFLVAMAIWLEDRNSPFYVAKRVGKNEKFFNMTKLRSMVVNADKIGVDSTSESDPRITRIGHFVRRYKLDELSQLWNVLKGEMSFVGPRPQVPRNVEHYTAKERGLLMVKPGITDISSIVFADEGEILKGSEDPDLRYNQVIRPWKSRLGLVYIENHTVLLDLYIIILTVISILSRPVALKGVQRILNTLDADDQLLRIARRQEPLQPYPPPGADHIVTSR